MSVLFLLRNRLKLSGKTSGLLNSATFVNTFLNSFNDEPISEIESVDDANQIDGVVTKLNPKIVIIEALWVTPAKMHELLSIPRHRTRIWIIRVHSKAPFLANEGIATPWIRDYCKIPYDRLYIAPNTEELTLQFRSVFKPHKFIYLPNLYDLEHKARPRKPKTPDTIDIGCFGALRPMKNTLQQAMAAIDFANQKSKRLRFHVNTSRLEQGGENVLKNLRGIFTHTQHDLIEHGWYSHKEFLDLIHMMDIGMQVSLTESFNIVSADFVNVGVPIVISPDIDWLPSSLKADPNDHEDIVYTLGKAYSGLLHAWFQRRSLKCYIEKSEDIWIEHMETYLPDVVFC